MLLMQFFHFTQIGSQTKLSKAGSDTKFLFIFCQACCATHSFARHTRNSLEIADKITLKILEKGNTFHLFSVYGTIFSSSLDVLVSQLVLFCQVTVVLPKPAVNANDNKPSEVCASTYAQSSAWTLNSE